MDSAYRGISRRTAVVSEYDLPSCPPRKVVCGSIRGGLCQLNQILANILHVCHFLLEPFLEKRLISLVLASYVVHFSGQLLTDLYNIFKISINTYLFLFGPTTIK